MPKIKIEFDKGACIGNKACLAMDFKRWKDMGDKVDLIDGKEISPGIFTLEGDYSGGEVAEIVEGAKVCPVNVIQVKNLDSGEILVSGEIKEAEAKEIRAEYDDSKEFVMDPKGYFLIRTLPEKKEIEVAFCPEPNKVSLKVVGEKPIEIYQTIINKENLELRNDHYAYLGRELQKAYMTLKLNIKYVQDDELKLEKA
jgi:ferredoxin